MFESQALTLVKVVDPTIAQIADAEAAEYLKGNRSAEAAAKIIDDKVMLYLNE